MDFAAGRIITVHVSEHTLAIELDDETRTIRRTTTKPVRRIKADRPPDADRPDLSATAAPGTEHHS